MGGPKPSEAPNAKFQVARKNQNPSTQTRTTPSQFEIWDLKFLWSLELGIWNFRVRMGSVRKCYRQNCAVKKIIHPAAPMRPVARDRRRAGFINVTIPFARNQRAET